MAATAVEGGRGVRRIVRPLPRGQLTHPDHHPTLVVVDDDVVENDDVRVDSGGDVCGRRWYDKDYLSARAKPPLTFLPGPSLHLPFCQGQASTYLSARAKPPLTFLPGPSLHLPFCQGQASTYLSARAKPPLTFLPGPSLHLPFCQGQASTYL